MSKVLDRSTPYHVPHSTDIKGFSVVFGGDERFYNNIFIGNGSSEGLVAGLWNAQEGTGTLHYNNRTTSLEDYLELVHQEDGDHHLFYRVEQPVYINNNVYLNGAEPFDGEKEKLVADDFDPEFRIIEEGDKVYLSCRLPEEFEDITGRL